MKIFLTGLAYVFSIFFSIFMCGLSFYTALNIDNQIQTIVCAILGFVLLACSLVLIYAIGEIASEQ